MHHSETTERNLRIIKSIEEAINLFTPVSRELDQRKADLILIVDADIHCLLKTYDKDKIYGLLGVPAELRALLPPNIFSVNSVMLGDTTSNILDFISWAYDKINQSKE